MAKKVEKGSKEWLLNECFDFINFFRSGLGRDMNIKGADIVRILELVSKINDITPSNTTPVSENEIRELISFTFRDENEK